MSKYVTFGPQRLGADFHAHGHGNTMLSASIFIRHMLFVSSAFLWYRSFQATNFDLKKSSPRCKLALQMQNGLQHRVQRLNIHKRQHCALLSFFSFFVPILSIYPSLVPPIEAITLTQGKYVVSKENDHFITNQQELSESEHTIVLNASKYI